MFGKSGLESVLQRKRELACESDRLRGALMEDAKSLRQVSSWLGWGADAAYLMISHRRLVVGLLGVATAWAFRSSRRQVSPQTVAADVQNSSKTSSVMWYGRKAVEAWRVFQRVRKAWAQWRHRKASGSVSRDVMQ